MRSLRSVVVAVAILSLPFAHGAGVSVASPTAYLVGYEPASKDVVVRLVASLGGEVTGTVDELDVLEVSAPSTTDLVAALANAVGVTYVEVDGLVGIAGAQWNGAQWNGAQWNGNTTPPTDPGASQQWGLLAANVPPAWSLPIVRNAKLCVIDSGVDHDHPDLAANVWSSSAGTHGYNAINGTSYADDDAGHGTHMAGIAAAVRSNGIGIMGVSTASIMSAKVLGADGHGKTGDLAAGMVWCADHGADVALMSLSVDGQPKTIARALEYLAARNVVAVASAGNAGPCISCVSYPGRAPSVIAVAAVGQAGTPAAFSSMGPQVALAAPGVDIVSTFDDAKYASGSGTSQAAAWVAGAAALLRSAHPGMSPAAVRAALTTTAHDLGAPGRDDATGAGMLDVAAAMKATSG